MRVAVYWNLHKQCFSVQSREGESYGRVIRHANSVILRNVTPVVRETGRLKVLREGRKNVHAFLVGEEADTIPASSGRFDFISYNPYRMSTFRTEDDQEVVLSEYVHCLANQGRPSLMSFGTLREVDMDVYEYP